MKSRAYYVFSVIMAFIFIISVSVLSAQFSGGDGSEEHPYLVEDAEQLNQVRYNLEAHFRQIANIDLSDFTEGEGWEPIKDFAGVYNGLSHYIENLVINRSNDDNIGLFGSTFKASITGIKLREVSISGKTNVGSLIGYSEDSNVYLCNIAGSVEGDSNVGGLIGYHKQGMIVESYSLADVVGNDDVGTLIGQNVESVLENCYALGSVEGENNIGGLVGSYDDNTTIIDCYAAGEVNGIGNTGGLIGYGYGTVINSYWDEEKSGQETSAGGEGRTTAQMTYPYDSGTYVDWNFDYRWLEDENEHYNGYPYLLRSPDDSIPYPFLGGGTENNPFQIQSAFQLNLIRGYLNRHFVQTADINLGVAPYNEGEGWEPIGYMTGEFESYAYFNGTYKGSHNGIRYTISNLLINRPNTNYIGLFGYTFNALIEDVSLIDVSILGQETVGALVGLNHWYNNISGCYITGDSSTVEGLEVIGGLIGVNYGYSEVINCYSSALVAGDDIIGGLVGYNHEHSEIHHSYSSGNVYGYMHVGGLTGINQLYSIISNCYSVGSVNGYNNVGGLLGYNYYGAAVLNCYSTGEVFGDVNVGGFVGRIYYLATVSNSYWDTEASGQSSSAGGAGRTTYQMLWEDNYVNWVFDEENWQFVNPNDHIREAYPILSWQEKPEEYNYAVTGHIKLYHQGIRYYWESFPRLECQDDPDYTVDLLEDLEGIVIQVESINYPYGHQNMVWDEGWSGDEIGFIGKYGYQLKFSNYNQYDLYVKGPKLADDTVIELFPDGETWIGYFLRETQHAFDAFGDLLDDFVSIEGEHWSMRKAGGMWWHQSYPPPLVEYGKMYIVHTEANLDDPYLFSWSPPSGEEESFARRMTPECFTFSDLPRYESIFIESMDNDQDVLEVAVYAGNDCVGASVFYDTYPLEILAYTGNHAEETLSFVIHRGGERGETERVYVPQVMDPETGKYSPRILRPREQRFSIVRLGAQDEEIETIVKPEVTLAQNYPNPMFWNNTASRSYLTQIPFYVSETREVTLSIYNIKGQLVKTLFTGTVNAGKHTIGWNGLNEHNRQVGSGVYFYLLETEDKQLTRKMLLIR